ncbi:MAG: hypothetical protein WCA29_02390, partial [Jiangellales bacterium]
PRPASDPGSAVDAGECVASGLEVMVGDVVARSPWGRFGRVFGPDTESEVGVSEKELLRRLADAEGLITQLAAAQGRLLLELRERRLATQRQETGPDGHAPGSCTRGCCDPDGWMGLEVAQALAVSERQVSTRLDTAQRLARHTRLRDVVEQGRVQVWTATKLAEHLDELATLITPDRLRSVEASMVVWLLDRPRTVGQMSARMRRLIHAARAAAGVDCPRRDAGDRRVWVEPAGTDGLATLMARLPETDALTVRAVLTAVAHDPTSPTDTRTREQRRADLLTTMITGAPATYGDPADTDLTPTSSPGNPGGVGVQVTVTIPADTLSGGPAPGEVPGYGPLPAATARDLAAHATSCRALVYHPDTGHLLGLSTLPRPTLPNTSDAVAVRWLDRLPPAAGYTHPPVMERLAKARDTVCRAPGCTRAATACDCDHVVPYPHGPTTADNTCCLCRRHHRLKTHAPHWHTQLDQNGRLIWTTPTGRVLTTDPHDHRPDAATDTDADPPPF